MNINKRINHKILSCLLLTACSILLFFSPVYSTPQVISEKSIDIAKPIHIDTAEIDSNNTNQSTDKEILENIAYQKEITDKLKDINKNSLGDYATLITALAVLATAFVSIVMPVIRRPKLILYYNTNKKLPYFHTLSFGSFSTYIDFDGLKINIENPGFNSRLKVFNDGKTTAKNVQARVEKIEIDHGGGNIQTRHYHPTAVKWSGEPNCNPVNIVPKSFFFLDIFHSVNETTEEIYNFNLKRLNDYKIKLDCEILRNIIQNDIKPSNQIYWNVWVDQSYDRGIPKKYVSSGIITIYFVMSAENCNPLRFQSIINWSPINWNKPDIKFKYKNKDINKDKE